MKQALAPRTAAQHAAAIDEAVERLNHALMEASAIGIVAMIGIEARPAWDLGGAYSVVDVEILRCDPPIEHQ